MKTLLNSIFSILMLAVAGTANAESLWLKSGVDSQGHYADHRARAAGDIVTVVIQESSTMSATQNTKADKTSAINDSVTQFLFSAAASKFGTKNGEFPKLETSGSNTYEGKGKLQNDQSVSAKAAVIVTDVLPNGNLVIEGVRMVAFAREKQYVVLRGIVRGDDVAADNTISSTQIANATVEVIGEGDLSSAAHKGWFTKLNDFINPF